MTTTPCHKTGLRRGVNEGKTRLRESEVARPSPYLTLEREMIDDGWHAGLFMLLDIFVTGVF